MGLFSGLADQLDQRHPLYQLANRIKWSFFDDAFKKHYSEKMPPPIQANKINGFAFDIKICSQPQ